MNGHAKQRSFSTMQILFNKTIEQCRQLGARGGRAYARNLRLRQSQTPVPPVAQLPAPPLETVHQASLRLDAQFPWLAEASARRCHEEGKMPKRCVIVSCGPGSSGSMDSRGPMARREFDVGLAIAPLIVGADHPVRRARTE